MAGHHAHMGVAYTLDVTPWLDVLNDGRPHTFTFRVGNMPATFWWAGAPRLRRNTMAARRPPLGTWPATPIHLLIPNPTRNQPTPTHPPRYVAANLLLWRDPSLASLTLPPGAAARPAATFFSSPPPLKAGTGTLSGARTLTAQATFAVNFTDGTSATLAARAECAISQVSNAASVSPKTSTWANNQRFRKSFTLARGGAPLHDLTSDFAWGARRRRGGGSGGAGPQGCKTPRLRPSSHARAGSRRPRGPAARCPSIPSLLPPPRPQRPANTGSTTKNGPFQAIMSFNQSDAAYSVAPSLSGAGAAFSKPAVLEHWQVRGPVRKPELSQGAAPGPGLPTLLSPRPV
jgi:hypothetical protein